MACSTPPMYTSTGSVLDASGENRVSGLCGSAKRVKYQLESTKVSMVSVSLFPGPLHLGQEVLTKSGDEASALPASPFSQWLSTRGNSTGRSSSGTGTAPQESQ